MKSDLERMSRACRPTLFDVAADPELLIALLLANLTSPALWRFRDQVAGELAARQHPRSIDDILLAIQTYADRHLFHISPLDVADTWGLLDLDEERARLGHVVDTALAEIIGNVQARRDAGILSAKQDILGLIAAGRFPEYQYANIDIIRAYPRLLQRKKHKPLGITNCADEAVLLASLSTVLQSAPITDALILGAPAHYTLLLSHDGEGCWFNGKHEVFTETAWRELVAGLDHAAIQAAVDRRMDCDRFIAPTGVYLGADARSSLPYPQLDRVCRRLNAFFRTELDQVAQVRAEPPTIEPSPVADLDWTPFDQLSDAASAHALLRRLARDHPGSLFEAGLYAARDLGVDSPEVYLAAGARGHLVRARAADVHGIDDALNILRGIGGSESVLHSSERVALPDEVLKFDTGDAVDRAFLLCTLIGLAPSIPAALREDREILLGADSSYARLGSMYVRIDDLSECPAPLQPMRRIATQP